jgi:adenosyl cobinamide kinase/adenosyl cobinamide phosphate guanylyltransferase
MSLVLLIGGARSGKSTLAVELASRWNGGVTFIATAEARDDEMSDRIARHRAHRPREWRTIEEPVALGPVLRALPVDEFAIVDCLTVWVANLLERRGPAEIPAAAEELARLAADRRPPLVAVTNEVGLGVVPATPLGRMYRDLLGQVNGVFAERSERAYFVVAGRALPLAGAEEVVG